MRKILIAAAAAVLAAVVCGAPASAAVPANTCPARNTCFWSGTGYTGTQYNIANSVFRNQWGTMPARGSVQEQGNSALELWDAQTGQHTCLLIGRGLADARMYGHFYIAYGAGSCAGIPPYNGGRGTSHRPPGAAESTWPSRVSALLRSSRDLVKQTVIRMAKDSMPP